MRRIALLCALTLAACGEEETALLVQVDLTAFEVPDEVNLLYLELADDDGGLLSERFEVVAEQRPVVKLRPGGHFPGQFHLVVFAYLDDHLVASSNALALRFDEGNARRVNVRVEPVHP